MGVPKYRRSRSMRKHHQGHLRAQRVTVSECPRCHEPKLPHRVCVECGFYNGMEIIKFDDEDEE